MNIIILSFVCDPNAGTEAGIGWHWANAYLKLGHHVTILTHESQKQNFGGEILDKGLKVCYLGDESSKNPYAPTGLVEMFWMRSLYSQWLRVSNEFMRGIDFDLVQHVSWSTIRVISPIGIYGKRAILGPLGGGHKADISRIPNYDKFYEFMRNMSVIFTILSQRSFNASKYQPTVLVTNEETKEFARKVGYKSIILELADGIESDWIRNSAPTIQSERIQLLWAGRLVASKRPDLAVTLLSKLVASGLDCNLSIAGSGNQIDTLQKLVKKLDVKERVDFLGHLSRNEIKLKLDNTKLVVFTSFRDSSCPLILEAAARGVPTIAVRNQGVKTLVPENVAIGPDGSLTIENCLNDMHQAILQICHDNKYYSDCSASCIAFAHTQEWSIKAQRVLKFFANLDE